MQWFDHRLFVGGGDQQRIDFPRDQCVDDWRLLHWIELSGSVDDQLRADLVGFGLGALLHRDVERVAFDADNQGDGWRGLGMQRRGHPA